MSTEKHQNNGWIEYVRLVPALMMCLTAIASAQVVSETPGRPVGQILSIVEISGRITDASQAAIPNAIIKAAGTDVSAVLTDAEGRYKFYLVGQTEPFTLSACKEGYETKVSTPVIPKRKVTFDTALEPAAPGQVEVTMERFVSGRSISGKVTGLASGPAGQYKVLVYVQTNQWYIHPYAQNKPGKGYAKVEPDGSWTIETVNRGHGPFKLAILVVRKDYIPPAVVAAGEDADESLKNRIGSDLVACGIQLAPEGL